MACSAVTRCIWERMIRIDACQRYTFRATQIVSKHHPAPRINVAVEKKKTGFPLLVSFLFGRGGKYDHAIPITAQFTQKELCAE